MFKNYFILNRLAIELNEELQGYDIVRSFSYEKDKLALVLSKDKNEILLEISVNSGFPFLNLKRKFSIPKKNLIHFFVSDLPLHNISFEIADNDRIIRVKSDEAILYFTIRGKYTNVYLINESEIQSFKKTDEIIIKDFRQEVSAHTFISEFNDLTIDNEFIDPVSLRKKYPIIGREIIDEIIFRENNHDRISNVMLKEVMTDIKNNKSALFIDEVTAEINLGISTFTTFPFTRKESFESLAEAYNHFMIEKFSIERTSHKKKIIEKHLDRELSKISWKLNSIQAQIQKGSREKEYNEKANILLINISRISKGMDEIKLQDIYDEKSSITIKLDPKLSPRQNVDLYYEKSKNEKVKLAKANQLFSELNKKFLEMNKIKEKFMKAEKDEDIDFIMKELKIKQDEKKKPEDDLKNKFRHYIIQDKYNVYVGKDSKSNDLLTTKFAKQNDYWFHARSVSGSHVVLKNENSKEGIPKNILKLTASIAAYHSKAKTSGMVPVSYTQKKYVTKKKGMEPGKVALLREEVLIVRPQITQECKYVGSD